MLLHHYSFIILLLLKLKSNDFKNNGVHFLLGAQVLLWVRATKLTLKEFVHFLSPAQDSAALHRKDTQTEELPQPVSG